MHGACLLVNAVDDPVGSAAGTVTSGERAGQWLADPVKIDGERGAAEPEPGAGAGLGRARRDRAAGGWLEADVVPAGGLGCHAPVPRRLARSWRTVARSAPGSPRPGAARRSEIRAAASPAPRISRG